MIPESTEKEVSPLKTLREMLGLTQPQFANLLGVSLRTVSRWETGGSRPSFTPGQWRRLLEAMAKINLGMENLPDDLTPGNHLILSNGGLNS